MAFAVFLPFVGQGERVEVLGLSLSVAGLWAAWNILAKGTLGVAASVILAATTPVPDCCAGSSGCACRRCRHRSPASWSATCDVITDEMRRMRIARESRGYDPRWIWQARAVAAIGRRPVHPLLRAGRAGAPGHGVAAGYAGLDAGARRADRGRGRSGASPLARAAPPAARGLP